MAYAAAVAAKAGYGVSEPTLDRDGYDVTISAGGSMRPKIDVQLKATINLRDEGTTFAYALKRRNYDLLREPAQTPRMLVVLHLPKERKKWLTISNEYLTLKNCAYWLNLVGMPATKNKASITVKIPKSNLLTDKELRRLMDHSRSGSLPT